MKLHRLFGLASANLLSLSLAVGVPAAQAQERVVIIGDSISEGVQSGDAGRLTQPLTYGAWVSALMGTTYTAPFMRQGWFSVVGDPSGRSRFFPDDISDNVAVSGATVADVLRDRADAATEGAIDTEVDLVMFPRLQTQIEYAESDPPDYVLCWIGNNDVLSAAINFSTFDASQMTSVADFDRDFTELADRLGALNTGFGTRTVFANIPKVTDIGFLVDKSVAEAVLGFPISLGEDDFTSVVAVLQMGIFGNDNVLSDPNFVLDAAEVATILDRIEDFNAIIDREAARIGMPVVDANAIFEDLVANPLVIAGRPLTKNILGGLFSLDGVHPNNIAHVLIANAFINSMNSSFGLAVPQVPIDVFVPVILSDPHFDRDGDGQATGRFGGGLLETIALLLGVTGDGSDSLPGLGAAPQVEQVEIGGALEGAVVDLVRDWTTTAGE